ncbi:hypothetical protein I4U23_026896 [Adineta vaga]|nr:hypothetical protein I4U23_026896 [Adineta vaga]
MSDINANMEEEVITSDMKSLSLSNSSTMSEEEVPFPRPQYTCSVMITSPIITTSQLSTSRRTENEFDEIILPYPLRLEKDYLYEIGLKPNEFINYCQMHQMKFMFDSPMDLINNFIQCRLKQGLDMGLHEECLKHLNDVGQIYSNDEPFEHYVYDYIEAQVLKSIHLPNFDSPPDNQWSEISSPKFDSSTMEVVNRNLNVYPNRYNFKRRTHGNLNVFDLLLSNQTENDRHVRFYHGTDMTSVETICQYGINLYASHRLGSDFGPGFYVTDSFDDALYIAVSKGARNKTLGGVICFQLRETELNQFNIQELSETVEYSMNPLKWSNFVKLCRRRFVEYPHVLRRDAFHGAICNNAEKVRQIENERPQVKIIENRTPTQLCIKSTNMASRFECSILGVYMIGIAIS